MVKELSIQELIEEHNNMLSHLFALAKDLDSRSLRIVDISGDQDYIMLEGDQIVQFPNNPEYKDLFDDYVASKIALKYIESQLLK